MNDMEIEELSVEMREELESSLSFVTQYDKSGLDDRQIIEDFISKVENDSIANDLISLVDVMNYVDDEYNQVLYNIMKSSDEPLSENFLSEANEIWELLNMDDEDGIIEALNIDVDDYMDECYGDVSYWEDLADIELRDRGIDANCLSWLDELSKESSDYLVLNGYANGFVSYNSLFDMLTSNGLNLAQKIEEHLKYNL